ncbi:NAD(P)H-dependent amine dehydrogenase family protein [Pseudofrankia inefficax]|uniref:Dihydrodipicolinate reductase n=1 Tax=Pseudofrankia inefficax (strain DSM 45817 / CECT 9037 / DDB 130130 / EuI1c) TaxID=298654 RepID=E3J878_PSEI1|nr:dihydrodipicolinate reductase [Pseudofrankia inefficax]ADP83271.1 dihydrodipicolinate reductase [Pseudofrankia inefficax]
MAYRVIQWATGTVAKEAVLGVLGRPDLELVGAWTHSADKDGRDLGDLYGLGELGVRVSADKEAVLATQADAVLFMVGRNWVDTPEESFDDLLQILRSGKNVVNLWWPTLVYPRGLAGDYYERLERAAQEGGSTFCTIGMDPGYGTGALGLSALGLSREVRQVRLHQVMNNAFWEGPGITKFFGFGQLDTAGTPILQPGVTTSYHETTIHLLADALGVTVDEIVEENSVIYSDVAFDVASGHIPQGTICGLRYDVKGMVGGEPLIVVGHLERLREHDFADFDFQGDGYRAEVTGEPCIRLDMKISALPDFVGDPIAVASAMSAVNAVPRVCAAPAGVTSLLDLPPFPSKNTTIKS